MKKVFLVVLVSICTAAVTVSAQTQKVLADKIAGQVGDRIILRSDVMNSLTDMQRQAATSGQENVVVPTACQVIEGQLIRKALLLQAGKDSLSVTEEELENDMENRIRMYIREYGSKEVLEDIAGKTIYQIKEDFRDPIRDQKLAEQMQRKIVENIKITPTEVRGYFATIPTDSLPFYESEVEMSQLVIRPKANKDVEEYVSRQMLDYKKQIEGGKKIDQLVKLYSEDPGSKTNGGEYQLNRNDKNMWDPAFLAAAFRLKEGQVSPVVKSQFGLHIIQMISRSGDEAIVRHILRIPPVGQEEIDEAKVKLDSIRKNLEAGKMSFNEAVSKYSDDEGSKFSAGSISNPSTGSTLITMDQLDANLIGLIKEQGLKPGQYSKPQIVPDDRGRQQVRIIYFRSRTEPHRENLKEDYNRIASRALEEKKNKALEKWFDEHVPTMYVTIDKEFMGCPELKEWRTAAAKNAQASN